MLHDIFLTVRSFRKSPVTMTASVFCLALGIGASVAVFSAVDAILLRPLPYQDANRLVNVFARHTKEGWDQAPISVADYLMFRELNQTFEKLVAFRFWFYTVGTSTESEQLHGFSVSPGFFELLGVRPILGREFQRSEEDSSNANVAMLSQSLWQRRFGGDRGVIGKTIIVDGMPRTIVGVLPDQGGAVFRNLGSEIELWLPLAFTERERV